MKFQPFSFLSDLPKQFGLRGVLHKGKLNNNEFVFYAMLFAGKKVLLKARQELMMHNGEMCKTYLDRLMARCITKNVIRDVEKKKKDKPKEFNADKYNQIMLDDFKFWRKTWEDLAVACEQQDFLQEEQFLADLDKVVARFEYWIDLLEKKREGLPFE